MSIKDLEMTLEQECREWLNKNEIDLRCGTYTVRYVPPQLLATFILQKQIEVLDFIAGKEGWEESRNHYARLLGLPEIEFTEKI